MRYLVASPPDESMREIVHENVKNKRNEFCCMIEEIKRIIKRHKNELR